VDWSVIGSIRRLRQLGQSKVWILRTRTVLRVVASYPVDHDHPPDPRTLAYGARFAIVVRIEPRLGCVHRCELDDDEPFRLPVAFQDAERSATRQEAATVPLDAGTRHFAVARGPLRIRTLHVHDDVRCHDDMLSRYEGVGALSTARGNARALVGSL
jgi:hypothetical protein